MNEFEVFRTKAKNNGMEAVSLKDFFETKIYPRPINKSRDVPDDDQVNDVEPPEDYIEYIDKEGNPQKMGQDDLMYVSALLGKVDWPSFVEKNKERIKKIRKIDDRIE